MDDYAHVLTNLMKPRVWIFIKLTFWGSSAILFRVIAAQGREVQGTHLVRSNLDMQILSCMFERKKHCRTM